MISKALSMDQPVGSIKWFLVGGLRLGKMILAMIVTSGGRISLVVWVSESRRGDDFYLLCSQFWYEEIPIFFFFKNLDFCGMTKIYEA
jgi:hypothetical protein